MRLQQSELPQISGVLDDEIPGEVGNVGVLGGLNTLAESNGGEECTVVCVLRIPVRVQ
ncbi:Uncharacterised protein [Mycobacteroides abscessus subsp. bolletii]|nr:Uncharacterised protein [Mycobacteroides abscessus subsp. bolletii]